ncbi:MAG TPA: hypothetical protein VMV86_03630, partial [Methanosarcinales archaeon]|nr:hypothetical protein [Methanosarcinales archaeon]
YGRVWVAASERVGIRQWGKIYDRVIGRVNNSVKGRLWHRVRERVINSAWVRIHTKKGLNNE